MQNIDEILARYFSNEATDKEVKEVNDWKAQNPEEFEQLALLLGQDISDSNFSLDRGKALLDSKLDSKKNFPYLRIAAAIALVFVASFVVYNFLGAPEEPTYLSKGTNLGEKRTLKLADGSSVKLNSGSSISYPDEFGDERLVEMQGEAYFDVTRNPEKPFIIKVGNDQVRVLGTSFNINSVDDQKVIVTVTSGKVRVSGKMGEFDLIKNHRLIIDHQSQTTQLDSGQFRHDLAWLDNLLLFENDNLSDVTDQLERWYGVTIEFKNAKISECKLTGEFKNETLKNVLESISITSNLQYELQGKKVILSGEGCN